MYVLRVQSYKKSRAKQKNFSFFCGDGVSSLSFDGKGTIKWMKYYLFACVFVSVSPLAIEEIVIFANDYTTIVLNFLNK